MQEDAVVEFICDAPLIVFFWCHQRSMASCGDLFGDSKGQCLRRLDEEDAGPFCLGQNNKISPCLIVITKHDWLTCKNNKNLHLQQGISYCKMQVILPPFHWKNNLLM